MAVKEAVNTKTGIGIKLKIPRRYKVLIYNDDFTPMDFVVMILQTIFDKEYQEAVRLMMNVHKGNFAVVGLYTKDIAQTKAADAMQQARAEGYPLKLEAVPEEKEV